MPRPLYSPPSGTTVGDSDDAAAKSARPATPAAPAAGSAESGFCRASATKSMAATFRSLVDGSAGADLRARRYRGGDRARAGVCDFTFAAGFLFARAPAAAARVPLGSPFFLHLRCCALPRAAAAVETLLRVRFALQQIAKSRLAGRWIYAAA